MIERERGEEANVVGAIGRRKNLAAAVLFTLSGDLESSEESRDKGSSIGAALFISVPKHSQAQIVD